MQTWKRNAIVATVLVLICAGIYLNWNAAQDQPVDLTDTLDAEQVMNDTSIALDGEAGIDALSADGTEDYFAQIRLSRQESRDSAVELLQQTMAYEEGSDSAAEASASLDSIVGDALAESQIESLVIAKGYADCVGDDNINIAVSAPVDGLGEADVALISDIVTSQTDYTLSEIRIIEVK